MKLLAIDPGSQLLGIALFEDGILTGASTLEITKGERLERVSCIIDKLAEVMNFFKPDIVVVEDPFFRGRNQSLFERMKGSIEATAAIILGWPTDRELKDIIIYISPTTVKKYMGSGSLGKLEVALGAGDLVHTADEKELIANLIDREEFDATDAIAIGLTYYLKYKPEDLG